LFCEDKIIFPFNKTVQDHFVDRKLMILQFTALELFLTAPPASSWYYLVQEWPPHLSAPDPKSGVSTNSTTLANNF
jgi:hypothetical protein